MTFFFGRGGPFLIVTKVKKHKP